mgnify:CR=1 FL=1
MWVYEEMIEQEDGSNQKLTDIINNTHENVKYLPGIRLPANVKAVADLAEACQDATLLIFVLPHQFLPKLLPTIRENAHPACRGVSLIKGLGKLDCSIQKQYTFVCIRSPVEMTCFAVSLLFKLLQTGVGNTVTIRDASENCSHGLKKLTNVCSKFSVSTILQCLFANTVVFIYNTDALTNFRLRPRDQAPYPHLQDYRRKHGP